MSETMQEVAMTELVADRCNEVYADYTGNVNVDPLDEETMLCYGYLDGTSSICYVSS